MTKTSPYPFSFDELKQSNNSFDFVEKQFRNSDNLIIVYYHFKAEKPVSSLLFVHGGGACSQLGYFSLAADLSKKHGIETILIDLQGHGKSEGKRGDCTTVESIYKDIDQLAEIIKNDKIPIYLGGHSSGGGMILNYHQRKTANPFNGFIFISPEFGYRSGTAKKDRTDFARICIGKFLINAFSGGRFLQHDYAVKLNYPRQILLDTPLLVDRLTVNMANALTPQNPQKQCAQFEAPIGIFIGEKDELFDPQMVIAYIDLQTRKNEKSVAEVIPNTTHLSILLKISDKVGTTLTGWQV